jgi:DNA-binding LytR/AlgR family response regulator
MSLNCLIVDDEPPARRMLLTFLSDLAGINIVKTCASAMEAYEALHSSSVDLMFLDIKMPVVSGIDFLKSLKNPPLVAFTTAYDKYAIEGYGLNVIDYLLKPITVSRLMQTIEKAKERISKSIGNESPEVDYIFIKEEGKLTKVFLSSICYLEGMQNYVKVYLKDGSFIIATNTMKAFEDFLPETKFVRIHRSYIVSLDDINFIQGTNLNTSLGNIPIGANYRENFFLKIEKKRM